MTETTDLHLRMLEQQQAMLKRLARVEGQIRGIQAMIKRGEDCAAIAHSSRQLVAPWTNPTD